MKYPCLVLDHDDTVVKSTVQIHYPAFLHTMAVLRPQVTPLTCVEFQEACAHPGLVALYQETYGYTREEMDFELQDWKNFVKEKIPDAHEGFRELLTQYKQAGGIICVVSHSDETLIRRDYTHHFGILPDMIFDLTFEPQKPDPAPITAILEQTGLTKKQLLVVDDLPVGWEMAQAAGVDFVYAGWCQTARSVDDMMRETCHNTANTVEELRQLIF